ncbi:hypothetical protein [Rhizohabitans arisaemae]|uniref:hypothetical protein n=1 Tax=Rhizohabitans arisaemae TaxID=2720610 RepID=UPI0024B1048F|nr:hypothetical protein [Rhizohabitans arisaemae]
MPTDLFVPILAGSFALGGGLGGALLTGWMARRNERRKLAADDERRWLSDRRQIYARYLTLTQAMHREIDSIGVFLSYDGLEIVEDEQEECISDGLLGYFRRWDDELQPILLEVQLMATPPVADLADRISGALLEITTVIELRGAFIDYYPGWFQAQDLLEVLRNAMRVELGLTETLSSNPRKRDDDWPWLSSRPSRESYSQHDANGRHITKSISKVNELPEGSTHDNSGDSQKFVIANYAESGFFERGKGPKFGWRWKNARS